MTCAAGAWSKMGKFGLQFKATLENVTNVRPVGDDFRWYLKLKCGNCGEVSDKWQYITLLDSMPLKGGRGSASMVQKCKLCSRENSIDILRDTITPYNKTVKGLRQWCSLSVEGWNQLIFSHRLVLLLKEQKPPPSSLRSTFWRKTGRTMMKKPVSLWVSMRSHTNSSSAEKRRGHIEKHLMDLKKDYIQMENATPFLGNGNWLLVVGKGLI